MKLYFQDPSFPSSFSLHEALIQACDGAQLGGGVYAFATPGGVKLFLEDIAFTKFISTGTFIIIVGTDEITSENTLKKLTALKDKYGDRIDIRAFLHKDKGSLFHPKFSWFKKGEGGVLVIGSGNLTEKGLRRNREAFNVVTTDESQLAEIQETWNNWLSHNENNLKPLDDADVIRKVKDNARIYNRIKKVKKEISEEVHEVETTSPEVQHEALPQEETQDTELIIEEDAQAWDFVEEDSALVAEIPGKKNNRWKQANFHKKTFEGYFGGVPGDKTIRILLRSVKPGGFLDDTEVRNFISVPSHNWRFELKAASRKNYPAINRPIGVFIRVFPRMFLYILAMPGDSFYNEVYQYLYSHSSKHGNQMREYMSTVQELKNNCSNLPFWNIME